MPKKTKKQISFFLLLAIPAIIIAVAVCYIIYTLAYSTGFKPWLSNQKENIEESIKKPLAPVKIAELDLKLQKANLSLTGISREVNKNDVEDFLKEAVVFRGDLEDIWRDTVGLEKNQSVQNLTTNLESLLTNEITILEKAKPQSFYANKLKLEIDLSKSLLEIIKSSI